MNSKQLIIICICILLGACIIAGATYSGLSSEPKENTTILNNNNTTTNDTINKSVPVENNIQQKTTHKEPTKQQSNNNIENPDLTAPGHSYDPVRLERLQNREEQGSENEMGWKWDKYDGYDGSFISPEEYDSKYG
ncbi:MAG: hypothetical protein KO202_00850 [Methanobacteriaceae archaeon]|nr:hypothetical protein [Methanobacteriaceae archaeon]